MISPIDTGVYARTGLVFFLFAVFCAYWAQTTGRNAWLWFFTGWDDQPLYQCVVPHRR